MPNWEGALVGRTLFLDFYETMVLLINEATLMLNRRHISFRADVPLDCNKHWVRERGISGIFVLFHFINGGLLWLFHRVVICWNLDTGISIWLSFHPASLRSRKYGIVNILALLHGVLVAGTSVWWTPDGALDHDFTKDIFKFSVLSFFQSNAWIDLQLVLLAVLLSSEILGTIEHRT